MKKIAITTALALAVLSAAAQVPPLDPNLIKIRKMLASAPKGTTLVCEGYTPNLAGCYWPAAWLVQRSELARIQKEGIFFVADIRANGWSVVDVSDAKDPDGTPIKRTRFLKTEVMDHWEGH